MWNLQQCLDYSNLHNYALNTLRLNKKTGEQNVLLSKAAVLLFVSGITTQTLTHGTNISSVQSQSNVTGNYCNSSSLTLYNAPQNDKFWCKCNTDFCRSSRFKQMHCIEIDKMKTRFKHQQ
ncbi:MAG: hypothetical protein ABJB86_14065 [Bacteroidota bacterium]